MECKEFIRLIDSYLKEEIPEEKKEAFEAHYFECDACFAELKLHERLYSKEIPIVLKGTKPFWVRAFKPLLVLSSLLIVVVSSLLVVNNYKQAKFLYDISGVEPPVYIETETRDTTQDKTFTNAMSFYSNQKYDEALNILNSIDDGSTGSNLQVTFFKGICYLETNQPGKAIKAFDVIIKNMNPSYYDEAIFYKGIALLRLNEKEAALEQFDNLASMFSPYAPKAKELIEKINKR
jgi:tetratricopeptide (TPR) repeat protein